MVLLMILYIRLSLCKFLCGFSLLAGLSLIQPVWLIDPSLRQTKFNLVKWKVFESKPSLDFLREGLGGFFCFCFLVQYFQKLQSQIQFELLKIVK